LRDLIEELILRLRETGLDPTIVFGAKPTRPGEPPVYAPDITQLANTLGWTPPTQVEVGLRRTVESMIGHVVTTA
jgi:dTDP-D-glucose 4,6-dehydratase